MASAMFSFLISKLKPDWSRSGFEKARETSDLANNSDSSMTIPSEFFKTICFGVCPIEGLNVQPEITKPEIESVLVGLVGLKICR